MSLIDLFRKKDSAPARSPVSKLDQQLPPLPPPPRMPDLGAAPRPPAQALPPLPQVKAAAPLPSLPKLPEVHAAPPVPPPSRSLPPLPATPQAAPPKPAALPPMPKLGDMPKISVPAPAKEAPPMPKLPDLPPKHAEPPKPAVHAEPPKHENSRLAKALEELTSADVDFSAAKPAPKAAPAAAAPRYVPAPPRAPPGQKFLTMDMFEDVVDALQTVQDDIQHSHTANERLGMIENQKKNSYDNMVSLCEQVQKQLLAIDDKLFRVK